MKKQLFLIFFIHIHRERKDPGTGKDWRQKEKRAAENEVVGKHHHWLSGRESEQTPGESGGQQSLVCCSPWGRKESDTT